MAFNRYIAKFNEHGKFGTERGKGDTLSVLNTQNHFMIAVWNSLHMV